MTQRWLRQGRWTARLRFGALLMARALPHCGGYETAVYVSIHMRINTGATRMRFLIFRSIWLDISWRRRRLTAPCVSMTAAILHPLSAYPHSPVTRAKCLRWVKPSYLSAILSFRKLLFGVFFLNIVGFSDPIVRMYLNFNSWHIRWCGIHKERRSWRAAVTRRPVCGMHAQANAPG